MPETLDPFLFAIDEAFDAAEEQPDVDDQPATTLREYLSSCIPPAPAEVDPE